LPLLLAGDGCCEWSTQVVAGVHNSTCLLLQSPAAKCRRLIHACRLLQNSQSSHAVVAEPWWAPAGGPACILTVPPVIHRALHSTVQDLEF
jgi:hypothetical protein